MDKNQITITDNLQRPRLLIVLNRLVTGGAAQDTLAMAHALSKRYEVQVVVGVPAPGEQPADYLLERYSGFTLIRLPAMHRSPLPLSDVKSYRAIKNIIRQFRPHIVHTHGAKPGWLGRLAAHRMGVPVIVHTFHGHVFHSYFSKPLSQLLVLAERWLAGFSSALVVINQKLRREIVYDYRVAAAEKVVLIPLGIEAADFRDETGELRLAFRKAYALKDTTLAVAIVGRLVPVKQQSLFVEVAMRMLRQHPTFDLCFFIVGDGPLAGALQRQITRGGFKWSSPGREVADAPFVFTSWLQHMPMVMAGLDVVMLTSLNEGTPVTLLEAMAAGKPVISTRVGGIEELVKDGENGLLANSAAQMVKHLETLYQQPNLRRQLGEAAAQTIQNRYARQRQAAELDALYRRLLTEKQINLSVTGA